MALDAVARAHCFPPPAAVCTMSLVYVGCFAVEFSLLLVLHSHDFSTLSAREGGSGSTRNSSVPRGRASQRPGWWAPASSVGLNYAVV